MEKTLRKDSIWSPRQWHIVFYVGNIGLNGHLFFYHLFVFAWTFENHLCFLELRYLLKQPPLNEHSPFPHCIRYLPLLSTDWGQHHFLIRMLKNQVSAVSFL
ncbi:hypothetical protein FKM82_000473 [Ascaphus truei]